MSSFPKIILREGYDKNGRRYEFAKFGKKEYGVVGTDKEGKMWGGWYWPIGSNGEQHARAQALRKFEELTTTLHEGECSEVSK